MRKYPLIMGLSILMVFLLLNACASLDETSPLTDSSGKAASTASSSVGSSGATSPGSSTASSGTTVNTPSVTVTLQPSATGTKLDLDDWCRKIIRPNLDARMGDLRLIIGNEMKTVMSNEVNMCHYSSENVNVSIKTHTWQSKPSVYPMYRFEEKYIAGVLQNNILQMTKKDEAGKKIHCEGINVDVTKADLSLRCE